MIVGRAQSCSKDYQILFLLVDIEPIIATATWKGGVSSRVKMYKTSVLLDTLS